MATVMRDQIFDYTGFHGCASRCRLRMFPGPDGVLHAGLVIVLTELEENDGTSIINDAEIVATEVIRHFGVDPHGVTFIEHYPERKEFPGDDSGDESFVLVRFGWIQGVGESALLRKPTWSRLCREQVERLTWQRWEPESYAGE